MIDLLNKLSKKYYLKLGDYSFSPLLKVTAGITLEYCHKLKENKCFSEPFIFCFPEKKAAALWTSIAILTNYYLDDYIDIETEGISLKRGDRVQIFGCIAEVERVSNDGKVLLKFKDQGQIPIPKKLRSQISLSSSKRTLNKHKKYREARRDAKHKRNPISKILEPESDEIINQKNLKSKVLLIAGRGQVKKFHEYLETVEIYGEKLKKVFPEGENLIISADLRHYKKSENINEEKNEVDFIDSLKKASEFEKFKEINETLRSLVSIYNSDNRISEEFDHQFEDLINEFKDDIPQLDILKQKYPGLSEDLNIDVRAVIINDITQLLDYPNTVKEFIETGIPVIVFSDRKVISTGDINSFQILFNDKPNAYRFNWNKKKISALITSLEEVETDQLEPIEGEDGSLCYIDLNSEKEIPWTEDLFIDQALWNQSQRYKNQTICINTYNGGSLDILALEVLKHIKSLDEFEILQKSFYQNLYPAIYAVKNSKHSNDNILELIGRFEEDLNSVKNQLPIEIAEDFINVKNNVLEFDINTKNIEFTEDTFSVIVPLEFDRNFSIPLVSEHSKTPLSIKDKIVFTGYPFNEYSGKYLINSVCVDFIPEIQIDCWPNEASLTYNYLRRRIEGGYFYDNLPEGIDIEQSLIIKSDSDIQAEIDSFLLIDRVIDDETQTEKNLELVHQFKYKGYKSNNESRDNWKVNCDVLNFVDGSFMFLSKGSKILCLTENLKGNSKVVKKSADQFFQGDIIFKYVKDRGAYVEISKRDSKISESYNALEYWKNTLKELFSKNNFSTKLLETSLRKTKESLNLEGNPTSQNLDRWLFDDEIISPDEDNLRLILSAAGNEDVESHLAALMKVYKIVAAHRISLSTRIKKEISKKISKVHELDNNFKINLDGEYIDVETRTVSNIDTNGVIVDYHNTRKILC